MSKNCLYEMSYIPLYEMSLKQLCKTSSRLENLTFFWRLKDISSRCLESLHKTSLRCLFCWLGSPTIKTITENVYVWSVPERVLVNPGYSTNCTCDLHKEWDEKPAAKTVVNICSNNEQKHTNDLVRKEQIVYSEKRQREKE